MLGIRTVGLLLCIAVAGAACKTTPRTTPSSARAGDLPFDPTTIAATPGAVLKGKGPYPVELAVRATRSLTATDGIALRVVASGTTVASVPVVIDVAKDWTGGANTAVFSAEVTVPLGDYEVELVHGDRPILGHAFKLAEVPVWGGGKQIHFFAHQNTRLDLDHETLRVARWVVEDEPTQAWVVEWWHVGKRVFTSKGRTDPWPAYAVEALVESATRKDGHRASIWTYGTERYAIPKDLIMLGGEWEARIYREGAPPVAITLELAIAPETQESRVASLGLKLSSPLFLRALPAGLDPEVLAAIPGKQPPAAGAGTGRPLIDPIAFDRAAVRALFRSPELARKWHEFLAANDGGRDAARAKRLRPEIVALLHKFDGPWQATDVPR